MAQPSLLEWCHHTLAVEKPRALGRDGGRRHRRRRRIGNGARYSIGQDGARQRNRTDLRNNKQQRRNKPCCARAVSSQTEAIQHGSHRLAEWATLIGAGR